jgi:hypothetical protein
MKKFQKITLSVFAISFALFLNFASPIKAFAQSVSCASAKQTCYEVYVSGFKVKTVGGKAQIKL